METSQPPAETPSDSAAQPDFVHLRLHTEYSLVDSTVRIKPLVNAVAERGMAAVAVTDRCNLFAMVKFYRAAQGAGIKPIFGADVLLVPEDGGEQPDLLVLLCQNDVGYANLKRLVSRGYIDGQQRGVPLLQRDWLEGQSEGLIALSGARMGDIGRALMGADPARAEGLLAHWQTLFPGRFYLEAQRTGRPGDEDCLHRVVALAARTGSPVVATNEVCFLDASDFQAHEARICISSGHVLDDPKRPKLYGDQQYLRSPQEMVALFSDLPEALQNSVEIARRCNLTLSLGENFLPDFPVPAGMSMDAFFRAESQKGLEARLDTLLDRDADDFEQRRQPYDERLAIELGVILQMGFPGYFLIVADFIQWAKDNAIPVGPGRGSGAGSLVAYALNITDLDPLEYDLLFERFLNPERVSMPDFDVDFCMERREEVINYVAEHYGRDHVSQIITYGSMAAKAVVRDCGRVLGHGYGFVDSIAKLIPFEIGMTLDKALEQEEDLQKRYQNDDEVRALLDLGLQLEGLSRNVGKHAGGIVISPTPLTDFTPLYCEEGSNALVAQFDKNDVEAVGLVKFDFLGLRTLTIIDWALQDINASLADADKVDISAIPLDDAASFNLLKAAETTAVFQLESRGMKELIKRLQPDSFEDIIALVALFRPGPLQSGMVDDFVDRKHGRAAIEYPHPDVGPILEPTYGIILYQEQVMQIAQVLAGYSLGAADMLRRAMGKKKPEEMAKQRSIFTEGAVQRGVDEKVATYIFDLMEKFAGYGFNKSHSAAYALVSYQTAWLKAHHGAAFMAAVLSSDMDNTDKVVTFIEECRDMKLKVVPPNINRSAHRFTTLDTHTVVYGLGAVKGVGEAAIEGIIAARGQDGPYKDLFDFCCRIDLRKANKRVLEALIRAGAMDCLAQQRSVLMASLPAAVQAADQFNRDSANGQADLFGGSEPSSPVAEYRQVPAWTSRERLTGEKDTLGLYLTGHPIDDYLPELVHFTTRIRDLRPTGREKKFITAGLVVGMRTMVGKRGGRMAFLTIDDRSARMEARVFPDTYEDYRNQIAKDRVLVLEGTVDEDNYSGGFCLTTSRLWAIDDARGSFASHLRVALQGRGLDSAMVEQMQEALGLFKGADGSACRVQVDYSNADARVLLNLGPAWRVSPSDELVGRLQQLPGVGDVELVYA